MTVHLVNLTNPMMIKGPARELLPVGEQVVRIRLPEGKSLQGIQLLCSESWPRVVQAGSLLTVVVPRVLDHEVIAIDF
jgi:hypothetical protein